MSHKNPPFSVLLSIRHRHSSPPHNLKNLPYYLRRPAAAAAREAIAKYLHTKTNLPLILSELIASTSPSSIASFLSSVPFPDKPVIPDLVPSIDRHLKYFPPPELDLVLESIGCSRNSSEKGDGAEKRFLLSDDKFVLPAAMALHRAGFPWDQIGVLYTAGLLYAPAESLDGQLSALAEKFRCSRNGCIYAACIVFPDLLRGSQNAMDDGLARDVELLIRCFPEINEEDNANKFLPHFQKMKAFYDAGVVPGEIENLDIVVEVNEAGIRRKLEFFVRLGMTMKEVGPLVLQNRDLLALDMDNIMVSVPEYLARIGLDSDMLSSVEQNYSHVMGRNRLVNLPGVLQAVGLTDWFRTVTDKNQCKFWYLDPKFVMVDLSYDMELAKEFSLAMENLKLDTSKANFLDKKEFLLFIGFGENKRTARAISMLHGTREQFESRFEFLLQLGLEYTELLKMIISQPNVLNQSEVLIQKKVNYLVGDLGQTIKYLHGFPSYLCIDLENKLKPRYGMLLWLRELGLLSKFLAPASVASYAEKKFMAYLYDVHPAAPKHWLECFSSRISNKRCYKDIFYNKSVPVPSLYHRRLSL